MFEFNPRLFAIWLIMMVKLDAVSPEQRITSFSSQHGDEGECSLNLCCKFEINRRLLAVWLEKIKFTPIKSR